MITTLQEYKPIQKCKQKPFLPFIQERGTIGNLIRNQQQEILEAESTTENYSTRQNKYKNFKKQDPILNYGLINKNRHKNQFIFYRKQSLQNQQDQLNNQKDDYYTMIKNSDNCQLNKQLSHKFKSVSRNNQSYDQQNQIGKYKIDDQGQSVNKYNHISIQLDNNLKHAKVQKNRMKEILSSKSLPKLAVLPQYQRDDQRKKKMQDLDFFINTLNKQKDYSSNQSKQKNITNQVSQHMYEKFLQLEKERFAQKEYISKQKMEDVPKFIKKDLVDIKKLLELTKGVKIAIQVKYSQIAKSYAMDDKQ